MFRLTRSRTSYANLTSTLALVIAVTGGGAAVAATLSTGSVTSATVKDGTLRAVDLQTGSVRGVQVLDGSVAGADVRDNSLKGTDIDEDSLDVPFAGAAEHAQFADDAVSASRLRGFTRVRVSAAGVLHVNDELEALGAEQTNTPGRYVVSFPGPMLGCFLMAGVAHNDTGRVVGSASAWITPSQDPEIPNLNKVTVETHAPGGDATPDPLPFSLMVICDHSPASLKGVR